MVRAACESAQILVSLTPLAAKPTTIFGGAPGFVHRGRGARPRAPSANHAPATPQDAAATEQHHMEEVMHNQGTTPHPAAEVRGGRHAPHPDQPGADRAELAHHLAGLVPPEQDAEAVKDHAKEVAASHAGSKRWHQWHLQDGHGD